VDTATTLADLLLRNRDPAARDLLQHAILAFPASQAIRAQYLFATDPMGMITLNPYFWNTVKNYQPALAQALATPTKPDPGNVWVKLQAMRTRKRPAEEGSPLHALNDFSDYSLNNLEFADASLRGARFTDSRVTNSDLRGSDLTGADLRFAEFENVDLSFAQLGDADLSDWNPATRIGNILLRRFMTVPAGLGRSRQIVAVQFTVRLRRANLDRARIDRAILVGADLRQASLRQAILREADLRQADLRGADLTGADLAGALLDGARFDCGTQWPDGFTPPAEPDPVGDTLLCRESRVPRR
jgi:hypothetical protein